MIHARSSAASASFFDFGSRIPSKFSEFMLDLVTYMTSFDMKQDYTWFVRFFYQS
jgi:hypothetical protein